MMSEKPMQVITTRDSFGNCELCGQHEELRPYGADNKWICFDCGMKDEKGTSERFLEVLNNSAPLIIDTVSVGGE